MSNDRILDELAFYTLAGQPATSRALIDEVAEGEAMGLGTAFISERYNKKEAATLSVRPPRSAIGSRSRPRQPTTTLGTRW